MTAEQPLWLLELDRHLSPDEVARLRTQLAGAGLGRTLITEPGMHLRRIPLDMQAVVSRWFGYRMVGI